MLAKIDEGDEQNWLINTATSIVASIVRKPEQCLALIFLENSSFDVPFVPPYRAFIFRSMLVLHHCFDCLREVLFSSEDTAPNQIPSSLVDR